MPPQMSQRSGVLYWIERKVNDTASLLQEAKGRWQKATAEQLLHLNGHGQDFRVGIFETKLTPTSVNLRLISVPVFAKPFLQIPAANFRWSEVGTWALRSVS